MIDRDAITDLVDRVQVRGLGYMLLLYMLNGSTVSELALMTREDRHTVSDCLRGLEMRQYVMRVQHVTGYKWFLSQTGLSFMRLEVGGIPANLPPTTTALLSSSEDIKAVVVASEVGGNPANLPAIDPELAAAFKAAGIGSNMWADLAKFDHVTEAYVTAHDAYRRGRGESTGMLITRLRCGDAVPTAVTVKSSRPKIMRR